MAPSQIISETRRGFFGGLALVAHLGGDAYFFAASRIGTGLGDGVGEGLFAVDVLAGFHGGQGDEGVEVVGRGDGDGVEGPSAGRASRGNR